MKTCTNEPGHLKTLISDQVSHKLVSLGTDARVTKYDGFSGQFFFPYFLYIFFALFLLYLYPRYTKYIGGI